MNDGQMIEAMATRLYDLEPLLFPAPNWMNYGSLTDFGKEKYRKRARVCLEALKQLGVLQ